MMKTYNRRPPGTKEGGQFAPGKRADTLSANPLSLQETTDAKVPTADWQDFIWDDDNPKIASKVKEFITPEVHTELAEGQQDTADTAAELWYQNTPAHYRKPVLAHLRGLGKSGVMCSTAIELSRNLQRSILNSPLPRRCVVYRGMEGLTNGYVGQIANETEIGDTIRTEGFWSTTTKPSTATSFAYSNDEISSSVLFRIETTMGKFLQSSSDPKGVEGRFFREYEVVVPHGAIFEIVDKTELPLDTYSKAKCTMVSLRLVGVEDDGDFDDLEEAMENAIEDDYDRAEQERLDQDTRAFVQEVMTRYRKCGLPIGGNTSDVKTKYPQGEPW